MNLKYPEEVEKYKKKYGLCVISRGILNSEPLTIYEAIFDELAALQKRVQKLESQC